MKKLIVFLGSALISLRPSVRDFYSRVKKKLIEGPERESIKIVFINGFNAQKNNTQRGNERSDVPEQNKYFSLTVATHKNLIRKEATNGT